jgi:sortase B
MRRFAAMILLAGSLFLLGMCGYILFGMFAQEQKDDALQEQLKIIYEKEDGESTETTESPSVHAGLLALHESNPDCIAWITIEGTVIDYPVMYHPEEENYYLKRDFNGAYSANGSLFISELCDPADCDNLIIYGHHMKSGKMFAALEGYKQREFYEEHPLILLNTLQGLETYQVFAAFCTPVYTGNDFAYYAFTKAGTSDAYDEYVSAVKEKSLYDTGITAVYGEKLLTLSTCEYSQKNGRMVVVAKKID